MTALRNIFDDLVDKKLWPIALLLVAALVALPLAFGAAGGDEQAAAPEPAPPVATAAAAGATPAAQQVSLEPDPALDKRTRKGKVRDPFKQLVKPAKAATTDSAATAPGAGGTPAATPGAETPKGTTPSGSQPSTGTTPSGVKVDPKVTAISKDGRITEEEIRDTFAKTARHEVVLRWAERGEKLKRIEYPTLLRSFPNSTFPLVVISHVTADRKKVRFVVNALARISEGGKCYPSRQHCRVVDVREGDSAIVQVAASPTEVAEYRLEVARIGKPD